MLVNTYNNCDHYMLDKRFRLLRGTYKVIALQLRPLSMIQGLRSGHLTPIVLIGRGDPA
jgi:hypothetical protein